MTLQNKDSDEMPSRANNTSDLRKRANKGKTRDRSASLSSEETEEAPTTPRRQQNRVGFTPPPKNGLRIRRLSSGSNSSNGASEEEWLRKRGRDMSPSAIIEAAEQAAEHVRNYLEDVAEAAEDVMERLSEIPNAMVSNVSSAAHNAADAVKQSAHNAADAVKTSATSAKDAVSSVGHSGAELAAGFWKACHFEKLPHWLKDNEHLHFGHRPELKSFAECFRSIFRIHTETGNIWTHLIGCVAFVIMTIVFYVKPLCTTCKLDIDLGEKLVFLVFFIGAIVCLGCSALFHTLSCHSKEMSSFFSRLDYAGIAILIVGSVIPWLYYGFYCQFYARLTYMIAMTIMGILTIVLTLWEKFNLPEYRAMRATVFVALAGIAVIPLVHHVIEHGFYASYMEASMHVLVISGASYLTGAVLYAARIPERFYPGKCDIWFQSHQLFHVLVLMGAFIHYHGISEMAMYRLQNRNSCDLNSIAAAVSEDGDVWAEKMNADLGGVVF